MVLGWGRRAAEQPTVSAQQAESSSAVTPDQVDITLANDSVDQQQSPGIDSANEEGLGSSSVALDGDNSQNDGGGDEATMSSSLDHDGRGDDDDDDDDDGGDGQQQQPQQSLQQYNDTGENTTPTPLFPPFNASTSGGLSPSNISTTSASGTGTGQSSGNNLWPPPPSTDNSEKSKKLKRDRNAEDNKKNVTRIDVYPNGESYVTTPDGTTTKTMATISRNNNNNNANNNSGEGIDIGGAAEPEKAPPDAPTIFKFTSNNNDNDNHSDSGGGGGSSSSCGGGDDNINNNIPRFAPGAGAQGIDNNNNNNPNPKDHLPSNEMVGHKTSLVKSIKVATKGPAPLGPVPKKNSDGGESSTTAMVNRSSPIHWQPQSTTSTCEFTHTISNYSQKRDSGCKKAEYSTITTDTLGNKWRLIIYVNGNGRASNHHLSLFLQVADAEDLPFGWNKQVSYVLTLEHPSGQSLGYAKRNPDKTFKLCPKAIDWGWSQFITSDRIQQEGYVNQNTLTVRASVSVKSSSVNIDPEDSELYLKCAVEEGNADAVKVCLTQEARVNCQFKDDLYTPLHTACSANNNNGDGSCSTPTNSLTNQTNNSNNSPSPGPISEGCLEVLDLLLKRGADVNACNKWRETPLLIAANNGHGEAVKRLLVTGADPSLCSEAGWSALTFAAHKGYDDIVGMLLDADAPVNCRVTEDLSTPLHKACAGSKEGHTSAVCQLLEGDADVHALNKWRETPLLTAANHGQTDAVEALLQWGADPCKCTDTGWSPLSIAAYKGHDDVVRLLLAEGAPTEEDDPTLSALLQAATKGLPDTVMLLLSHGADHTVTTKKGDTALSILVEQNLIDAAVEMSTDYGASIPRCSRDRKKVQRARLLINLRLKQMQRDGTGPYCDDSDLGESDAEPDNGAGLRALHDDAGNTVAPLTSSADGSKKKKKNKGGQKSIAKQEAEARAAEEALLLELEAEENAKTATIVATESSKSRKKKMKKKEKERQQKAADKAREEEHKMEMEAKAAKEKAEAAAKEAAEEAAEEAVSSSPPSKDSSSPVKKEKVVELTSKTVVRQKTKKPDINVVVSPSSKKSGQNNKEVSLPSPPSSSSAQNNKDTKLKKAREVSLPKPSEQKKSSSTATNRNKTNDNATTKKRIPGDNPIQAKKVPGDNPIHPRRIPGDNPVVVPRKIPGDNPKKIPGDNPKVQQSRGQKSVATPAKPKRGWENKTQVQQQGTSLTTQKKQSKQSNKLQPTLTTNKEKSSSGKKGKSTRPGDSDIPSGSTKGKHAATRSDESTQSTANSTTDSLPVTPTPGQKDSVGGASASSAQAPLDGGPKASVDDPPNSVQGRVNASSSASVSSPTSEVGTTSAVVSPQQATPPLIPVELPSVSIYRLEKLNEVFRHCAEARAPASSNNPLRVVDERMLRVVLYRWIIRASHGSETFLDPVIPSWTDEAYLKEFLQRQFISESRRPAGDDSRYNANLIPSIEVLRDAGATMAEICTSLARGVMEFRSKCEQQVPANWSDADINVAGMEEGSNVIIEWSGKSRLSIPYVVFNSLARRYVGDRSRLMSAIFSSVRRHEIMSAIADQTDMVCHLPLQTIDCLTKGVGASLETWSDSVSVYGNNYFCAMFPDVDATFGGLQPFAKEKGGGETILTRAGGAVVVVAPPENATASQCIRKMVDMSVTFRGLPLSFGVVLTSDCFVNANNASLSVEDLRALDPRLVGDRRDLISFVEVIPAGCSIFSKSSCMFLLIQSEAGKLRFPAHPTAMDIIRRSMRSDVGMGNVMTNFTGMQQGEAQVESSSSLSPTSPQPQQYAASAHQEAAVSSNPWEGGGSSTNRGGGAARGHRGRLFELVGDGEAEEEQDGMNNLLPGMLDSFDMNMFGGNNANNEVDIEAISLMGIGLNGSGNNNVS